MPLSTAPIPPFPGNPLRIGRSAVMPPSGPIDASAVRAAGILHAVGIAESGVQYCARQIIPTDDGRLAGAQLLLQLPTGPLTTPLLFNASARPIAVANMDGVFMFITPTAQAALLDLIAPTPPAPQNTRGFGRHRPPRGQAL